jgi:hypothetical protein
MGKIKEKLEAWKKRRQETKEASEEIKVVLNPKCKNYTSHHHLAVLPDGAIEEYICLHNDCNEDEAERVLLHESIHAILYHFLDEEEFKKLICKLINEKTNVDLTDYMKRELISSKYDNPSKLIVPSEHWFSSLFEYWDSPYWGFVDSLMKIK